MRVDVETKGVDELLNTLKRMEPSLAENGLRAGTRAVAAEVVKEARNNLAPHKRTGNLARSLGASARVDRRTRTVVAKARTRTGKKAKADGFYGRFLEFGTKYIAPIRFLGRAGEAVTPRANDIMRRQIAKNLPKIVARAKAKGII